MVRLRGAGRGTPSLACSGPRSAVPLRSETLEPHIGLRSPGAVGHGLGGRGSTLLALCAWVFWAVTSNCGVDPAC